MSRSRVLARVLVLTVLMALPHTAGAQPADPTKPAGEPQAGSGNAPPAEEPLLRDRVFDMGEIVVIGSAEGMPGVGGALLTRDQMWTFDRNSLDRAVNLVPGVVSTFDANGRRNESDVFVRG